MNNLKLTSTNLPLKVECPSSKSYAARALIIAALSKEDIKLSNLPIAQDTLDLINVLKQLGIKIDSHSSVSGSFPNSESSILNTNLNLGEGGTTIRFLLPLLSLGQKKYTLTFEGRMQDRPMLELYEALRMLGVLVEETSSGVNIQGPIDPGLTVELDCTRSSQFASALELINHFYPLKIKYKNLELSKTYFEMTQHVLSQIHLKNTYEIPADFSCAGYFMAYAIFTGDLEITNIYGHDPFQADSSLLSHLKSIGVHISYSDNGSLQLKKANQELKGLDIDGSKCIDLVPTLCFIAAHISKESIIRNIKALRHKESDRLTETIKILDHFGVIYNYNEQSDLLTIQGRVLEDYNEFNYSYDPPDDHRMVMVASLFLKLRGGGLISNTKAVRKSFPQFFDFFK